MGCGSSQQQEGDWPPETGHRADVICAGAPSGTVPQSHPGTSFPAEGIQSGLSISRDICLYKLGPVTDRLGWSSCSAPLLLDVMSTLSPAAAGNQGQNPTMSPLGQGRAFCPGAPQGTVLRTNTLTPRTRDTSGCALLGPLGFLLLGNATLAFAQTSDAPGVPDCCLCGQMVLMAAQMCWDGGPRYRFLF